MGGLSGTALPLYRPAVQAVQRPGGAQQRRGSRIMAMKHVSNHETPVSTPELNSAGVQVGSRDIVTKKPLTHLRLYETPFMGPPHASACPPVTTCLNVQIQ